MYIYMYVCMCIHTHTHIVISLSIHLLMHTGYFHILAIVNSAARNTEVHIEGVRLSEIIQTERQIVYDITYMWNLKG